MSPSVTVPCELESLNLWLQDNQCTPKSIDDLTIDLNEWASQQEGQLQLQQDREALADSLSAWVKEQPGFVPQPLEPEEYDSFDVGAADVKEKQEQLLLLALQDDEQTADKRNSVAELYQSVPAWVQTLPKDAEESLKIWIEEQQREVKQQQSKDQDGGVFCDAEFRKLLGA